jgi:hypothetical protein
MKNLTWLTAIAAGLTTCLLALPANAQATRTWVSGVGDDANPCSRTAPCKTFAGSISKTARGGEISVLDPGGFGNVTITKSITINGTPGSGYGSILAPAASTGVIINITDPADTLRTVRLNWLDINGAGTAANGVRILSSLPGSAVIIENSIVDGFTSRGISDERTVGGELFVTNTTVRNTAGSGVVMVPNGARLDALIDNVRVLNSLFGVASGNGAKTSIVRSRFAGNSNTGVHADAGAEIQVEGSTMSGNGIGVNAAGTIRLSNSTVVFNATGLAGTVLSHGNNSIEGNTAAGTAPTLIAPNPSNPTGLK